MKMKTLLFPNSISLAATPTVHCPLQYQSSTHILAPFLAAAALLHLAALDLVALPHLSALDLAALRHLSALPHLAALVHFAGYFLTV